LTWKVASDPGIFDGACLPSAVASALMAFCTAILGPVGICIAACPLASCLVFPMPVSRAVVSSDDIFVTKSAMPVPDRSDRAERTGP